MSPNIALVSGAIAILALVVSVFGASWLNQRATERLVNQLEKRFGQGLANVDQRLETGLANVNQRLETVDRRLERIERQLEAIFKPMLPPKS